MIVLPISGEETQGAFIILDASKGYRGLGPMDKDDPIFLALLKDLVERNRSEALHLAHITVEYRDEKGESQFSFTVDQNVVEDYASGAISREEFYKSVHFNLVETFQRMGLQDLLKEEQP